MEIFTGTAGVILLMSRVKIDSSSPLILLVAIMIGLIVNLVLTPQFDRQRIRENVGANGGTVMTIIRVWGGGNRNDRAYEVSYIANGKRVQATCRTSMWRGVYWIDERPPGFDSEMAVLAVLPTKNLRFRLRQFDVLTAEALFQKARPTALNAAGVTKVRSSGF